MKYLCWILILGMSFLVLGAQDSISFTQQQQERIQRRWIHYQPHAVVALENGDTISGQPIHYSELSFFLLPSDSLPLNLQGRLISIPSSEISRVQLSRGGRSTMAQISGTVLGVAAGMGIGSLLAGPPGMFIGGNLLGGTGGLTARSLYISGTNEEIWLNPASLEYESDLKKITEWSVFPDSLYFTGDLRELPPRSASIRRAYPQKHFRISLGLNWGPSTVLSQLREVIEDSDLPSSDFMAYRGGGFELLDLSWRFKNRWIIGGAWMISPDQMAYASYDTPYVEYGQLISYNYSLMLSDLDLYMEYVIHPIDRFFTRRSEFLVGAGFVYSMPQVYFSYYVEEPANWDQPYYNPIHTNRNYSTSLPGLQLRAAYHYYPFRNISLSGGLVFKLYQNLEVPEQAIPDGTVVLKAHHLNYSTVRFKIGAHLYF